MATMRATAVYHRRAPGRNDYNERRKFSRSRLSVSDSALKRSTTTLASEPRYSTLPALLWARMAATRSVVRPSWRKKMRWPRPHNGAVRNSSPPAAPWLMSSASPGPMLCTRRSEYRLTGFFRSAATLAFPVYSVGVWQYAQPTLPKSWPPLLMDDLPPGWSVDGCWGARNRMKNANRSIALIVGRSAGAVFGVSFGVSAYWLPGVSSGSVGKRSLVMPISTL